MWWIRNGFSFVARRARHRHEIEYRHFCCSPSTPLFLAARTHWQSSATSSSRRCCFYSLATNLHGFVLTIQKHMKKALHLLALFYFSNGIRWQRVCAPFVCCCFGIHSGCIVCEPAISKMIRTGAREPHSTIFFRLSCARVCVLSGAQSSSSLATTSTITLPRSRSHSHHSLKA